eukprot:TRINITY_DN1026_c0_g1_i5.p1 TRINITY_DN1026_c0_g1~~TRINITY_DN1026_c0_g1_i5.p1  ORF type:complete len:1140 (-),score=349.28 TRINITY_DN1026_c0_g1_i5:654-4073(-)
MIFTTTAGSSPDDRVIVDWRDGGGRGFLLNLAGSYPRIAVSSPEVTNWPFFAENSGENVLGAWTHVIGSYDVRRGVLELFIDGNVVASVATARFPMGTSTTAPKIGGGDASKYFQGLIDDVIITDGPYNPFPVPSLFQFAAVASVEEPAGDELDAKCAAAQANGVLPECNFYNFGAIVPADPALLPGEDLCVCQCCAGARDSRNCHWTSMRSRTPFEIRTGYAAPQSTRPVVCGDGITTTYDHVCDAGYGEQCDDGNTEDDDGCDSTCKWHMPSGSVRQGSVTTHNLSPGGPGVTSVYDAETGITRVALPRALHGSATVSITAFRDTGEEAAAGVSNNDTVSCRTVGAPVVTGRFFEVRCFVNETIPGTLWSRMQPFLRTDTESVSRVMDEPSERLCPMLASFDWSIDVKSTIPAAGGSSCPTLSSSGRLEGTAAVSVQLLRYSAFGVAVTIPAVRSDTEYIIYASPTESWGWTSSTGPGSAIAPAVELFRGPLAPDGVVAVHAPPSSGVWFFSARTREEEHCGIAPSPATAVDLVVLPAGAAPVLDRWSFDRYSSARGTASNAGSGTIPGVTESVFGNGALPVGLPTRTWSGYEILDNSAGFTLCVWIKTRTPVSIAGNDVSLSIFHIFGIGGLRFDESGVSTKFEFTVANGPTITLPRVRTAQNNRWTYYCVSRAGSSYSLRMHRRGLDRADAIGEVIATGSGSFGSGPTYFQFVPDETAFDEAVMIETGNPSTEELMHHMLGGAADPTQVGSMVEIADLAHGVSVYLGNDPRVHNTGSDHEVHFNFRDPTTRPKADSGSDIEALITNLRGWKTVTKANLFGNTLSGSWHRCGTRLVVRIESATGATARAGDTEIDLKVDRDNGIYGAAGSRVSTWDRPGDAPVINIYQTVPEADPSPALIVRMGFDAGTPACDVNTVATSCTATGGTAPTYPSTGVQHGSKFLRLRSESSSTNIVLGMELANALAVRTGTGLSAAYTYMLRMRLGSGWYSSCINNRIFASLGTTTAIASRPHFYLQTDSGSGQFAFRHTQFHKAHVAQAVTFGASVPEGQWVHVSVVADRGAHEASIIRVRQATGAGQPFLFTSRETMPIFNDGDSASTNFLSGICAAADLDIDDVRVYTVALTEKQIADIHDSTS